MDRGKCTTNSIEYIFLVAIVADAYDSTIVCSLHRQSCDDPRVLLIEMPSFVYMIHIDFDPHPMGSRVCVRVEETILNAATSSVQPD